MPQTPIVYGYRVRVEPVGHDGPAGFIGNLYEPHPNASPCWWIRDTAEQAEGEWRSWLNRRQQVGLTGEYRHVIERGGSEEEWGWWPTFSRVYAHVFSTKRDAESAWVEFNHDPAEHWVERVS